MCGIAGYWDWHLQLGSDELRDSISGMTQSLRHRGPDSGGLWIEKSTGMALGHRRLSIRDLSPLGHQPMISPDGRFVLSYNGEIYNCPELKNHLAEKNIYPKGTSDTEILLLYLMSFGVKSTLENIIGMYAFALWDRQKKCLTLARDRFGVKPLYWTNDVGKRFLFASEPDAFYCAPGWNPQIDMDSVGLYLRFGYIPGPYCIWQKVNKLLPAHYLEVTTKGQKLSRYWDSLKVAVSGLNHVFTDVTEEKATDGLDEILTDSVRRRMVSDVPLGAFLSGGIDSSVVTALMQKCSTQPVRTFSIGFDEDGYNEAPYAAAVARYLQTNHTELYLPASAAWEVIPELPYIYDEPFGDASAVPTTLLSRLTREYVTTALSGDGGDELFAGYSRYAACLEASPDFGKSSFLKNMLAAALKSLTAHAWDDVARLLPDKYRPRNAGARVHNYADLRLKGNFAAFYQRYYMQYFWHPDTILLSGKTHRTCADSNKICNAFDENLALMQFLDTSLYLTDDILTKVDCASMSCSLEARTPLLDHRVFAYAWRIPPTWRQKDGKGKYLLRKVLERYLPLELFDRPKMGFGIPIGQWITGPLREWAEGLLALSDLKADGIFRSGQIRNVWERHLSGASNWEYHLWVILMFQAWLHRDTSRLKKPVGGIPVIYA